jgi:hypothetical protein
MSKQPSEQSLFRIPRLKLDVKFVFCSAIAAILPTLRNCQVKLFVLRLQARTTSGPATVTNPGKPREELCLAECLKRINRRISCVEFADYDPATSAGRQTRPS